MAGDGEFVRITMIRGGCKMQERLLSMGISVEDEIEIVQRRDIGAVLISKAGNRYALGGGMAQKIQVRKV